MENICLFLLSLNLLSHIIRHQLENSSLKFLIEASMKKCLVVSASAPQSHMGLLKSLELWWSFCSLRWMNCSGSLVSNLPPNGSYIRNNNISFKEKKIFSIDLNCLIDSASCMVLSNLFHSLTQKGKKEQKPFISSDGKRWQGTCVWYWRASWCKKT